MNKNIIKKKYKNHIKPEAIFGRAKINNKIYYLIKNKH